MRQCPRDSFSSLVTGGSPDYQCFKNILCCVATTSMRSLQRRFAVQGRLNQTNSRASFPKDGCFPVWTGLPIPTTVSIWWRNGHVASCVYVRDCSLSSSTLAGSPSPSPSPSTEDFGHSFGYEHKVGVEVMS